MKKLYMMLMAFATAAMTITGCKESDDKYFTADEDDDPRILNTDIPESTGGAPSNLPAISRDANFNFTVIVTPARYTTVDWYIDGELTYTGNEIDIPLIAGDYSVKIVATTTMGKSTYRNCSLQVLPLDGDPALASDEKSRWCQVGTEKSIKVSNFDNIAVAYIGGTKLSDFKNENGTITFTVPNLEEGDYRFVAETADGEQFGCGNVFVTDEKYVDPGVQVVTLWEGQQTINWGDANLLLTAEDLANVPVGTTIKMAYNIIEAEYHCMRITTPWWGDNPEDDLVVQFDLNDEIPNPFEFVYTEACKALVDERGGMLLVGFGYEMTSITYEVGAASETTLWEGPKCIDWDADIVKVTAEEMADVPEGATIKVYWTEDPTPGYAAFRITSPWWGEDVSLDDNFVNRIDGYDNLGGSPFEFVWDARCIALITERGAMSVLGAGFEIEKITWTK